MNLLNIFKKKQSVLLDENGLNKIVQNMNREFYEIASKITEDANNVVEGLEEEYKIHYEKAKLLKEAGFNNAQLVKDIEAIEKRKQEAQTKAGYLKKVNKDYPNYKYISEIDLKRIISKYNMIINKVSVFNGYVPNNNLLDIKTFFENHRDDKFIYKKMLKSNYDNGNTYGVITKKEYDEYEKRVETPSRIDNEGKYIEDKLYDIIVQRQQRRIKDESYQYIKINNELFICAPEFEFQLMQRVPKPQKEIDILRSKTNYDPIIAMRTTNYGEEGYIIITAWGEDLPYDPKIFKDEELV